MLTSAVLFAFYKYYLSSIKEPKLSSHLLYCVCLIARKQVSTTIITHHKENELLTNCSAISQLHRGFTCVHLSYSYLTSLASLFGCPVQYLSITIKAPRGGLLRLFAIARVQPSLAQRLRKTYFHLLYSIE